MCEEIGPEHIPGIVTGDKRQALETYESHRCTVHFVKSLQLLTNKCTYITSLKTLKTTPTCFDLFRSSSGSFVVPC